MYKKIIVSFAVFPLIAGLLIGQSFSDTVQANSSIETEVISLFANYLVQSNNLVNNQIKDLISFYETSKFDDPNFVKTLQNKSSQKCDNPNDSEKSFSSYCLNQQLFNNLQDTLKILSPKLQTLSNQQLSTDLLSQLDFTIRLNRIVMSMYNQVYMAYPIHRQNNKIYAELELMLASLKKIQRNIKRLPPRFQNVTTDRCQ